LLLGFLDNLFVGVLFQKLEGYLICARAFQSIIDRVFSRLALLLRGLCFLYCVLGCLLEELQFI
jgi:hypothetical protein